MAKKRSSFAQHGPYLGIVAIVAVVAIVFLILNFAGVSPVGEAIRVPAAGVNVCQQGERCGFVTQTQLSALGLECTGTSYNEERKKLKVFGGPSTAKEICEYLQFDEATSVIEEWEYNLDNSGDIEYIRYAAAAPTSPFRLGPMDDVPFISVTSYLISCCRIK